MKTKGLTGNIKYTSDFDVELPIIDFKVSKKHKKDTSQINVIKLKKKKDSSTNVSLF